MDYIGKTKEECCEDLANAIIIQAAIDYRKTYPAKQRGKKSAKREIERIEAFFRSSWGEILCQGSGVNILKRLQQEQGVEL